MSEYEVGYRRPPKHTRFTAGKSGNPKGRPKGHLNLKTDLAAELGQRISLKEDGKPIKLTKQQALVKSLVARAIKGDPKAATSLIGLILRVFEIEPPEKDGPAPLTPGDEALIKAFLARHGVGGGAGK